MAKNVLKTQNNVTPPKHRKFAFENSKKDRWDRSERQAKRGVCRVCESRVGRLTGLANKVHPFKTLIRFDEQ